MSNFLKIFFYFICLLIFSITFGQNKEIDGLKFKLNNSKSDIEKAELLNQIADHYKSYDPEKLKDYANEALSLSSKINYKEEQGNAYINLGNYNIISGNYPKSLEYFSLAKNIFESEKEKDFSSQLARIYGSIGIVFSEQSNYPKSLEYYLKAKKIYEESQDSSMLSRLYNNVGIVYKAQKEEFKALQNFSAALKIQEKIGDKSIGITTTNIGNIYLHQKNYPKAFQFYKQAETYFQNHPNPRGLGELHNNLGLYYSAVGNDKSALESWQKAQEYFSSIQDKFGISDTYYHLGQFYFDRKNYRQSILNTQKSNDLAKELNVLETVVLTEDLLSKTYEKFNDSSQALMHLRQYSEAKDSLNNYENIRKIVQAEMNYEFDKRESDYKKQQEQREFVINEKSKRNALLFVFGILFLVLLIGVGFLFYNRNQLKKTLTLQKNLAEYEQKALHLQMNPHFVFNCLGSISSFIVQNGNDSAIKYLAKFSKLMRLTLEYSKESLIPVDKEIESLRNYLELEQLRFNHVFDFSINKDKNIEDDMALPPLLIQPFVENAIIHGMVPKKEFGLVSVDFKVNDKNLICTITDNGIGIEKSKKMKENSVSVHHSMALEITRKRLEIIENSTSKSSKLMIEEIKNENKDVLGTKVVLVLPVQYLEN